MIWHKKSISIWWLSFIISIIPSVVIALPLHDQPPDYKDTLVAGCELDYPPYCYVNEQGQADGFAVELFREAANQMGYAVQYRTGPWENLKYKLAGGKLDALPLVGRTPQRENLFDFTFPYITMHGAIVVRQDNESIESLEDLKDKQIAVMRGDNAEEFLRSKGFDKQIIQRTTFKQALIELSDGQHDAVVVQRLLALQLIRENQLNNLKIVHRANRLYSQSFCFAVQDGDDHLQSILSEGLAMLNTSGQYRQIYVKWFAPLEAVAQSKRQIIVGGDSNYPPYEFLDENGYPDGYNVELIRAIEDQLGMEIAIRLGPWKKIVDDLKKGHIDAIQGILYSPERDSLFDMSPAHTTISYVIVTHDSLQLPETLRGLRDKSVLVQQQDLMHEHALQVGLKDELIPVVSQEQALQSLRDGKCDYALVSRVLLHYYMQKHQWDDLKYSKKSVYSAGYCIGVAEGNIALKARLSEGLSVVKASGEYRKIYSKWLGVYEEPEFSLSDFLRYAFFILVPLIIVLVVAVIWTYTLKKRVRRHTLDLREEIEVRKETENALLESKTMYMNLFRSIRDALLVADENREIVNCNPAFMELFGYSLNEIRKRKTSMLYKSKKEFKQMGQALKNHSDDARDFLYTIHYQRKDGTVFPGETNVFYLEDQQGNVTGFMGLIRDVTKRLKAEEELRKNKEKAEQYLNISAEIILSLDHQGRIKMLNSSGYQLLGYEPGTLTGKYWISNFVPKDQRQETKEIFTLLMRGDIEPVRKVEGQIRTGSGEVRTILWHNSILFDEDHAISGTLSSGKDITGRKQMEQQLMDLNKELKQRNQEVSSQNEEYESLNEDLNEKNEQLRIINTQLEEAKEKAEESNKLKTAFLANMSHEIRTPMNGILGFANLLKSPDLKGEKQELYLSIIEKSGERMLEIISNLLDIARIESGDQELFLDNISVNEMVDELEIFYKEKAREQGLTFASHKGLNQEESVIVTDSTKLNQVLTNLMNNAFKYTKTGGVEIGYAREDKMLRFYVSDTGIGVSDDLKEKIFERFRQAETHHAREYEGAGLGLSISKAFVHMLGGKIYLDSAPGQGSIFSFTIPYKKPGVIQEESPQQESVKTYQHIDNRRILVVEDDPASYQLIYEVLSKYNVKLMHAEGGRQAIQMVVENDPIDLILMDVKMPGMDGYQATREIKKRFPNIPVVAQTAYASKDDRTRSFQAGCDEYIAKPLSEKRFMGLVERFIK